MPGVGFSSQRGAGMVFFMGTVLVICLIFGGAWPILAAIAAICVVAWLPWVAIIWLARKHSMGPGDDRAI